MSDQSACEIPEFLNENLFREALSNGLQEKNIRIISLNIGKGSNTGDNYLSNIYRVPITFTANDSPPREIHLIVKYVTDPEPQNISGVNVFIKEKYMYLNVLPHIDEFLGGTKIAPQFYHAIDNPQPTFFFEDMKASGYEMADRTIGLDESHCRLVLDKLGRYHAGSLLLLQKNPSIRDADLLQRGLFASPDLSTGRLQEYIQQRVRIIIDHLLDLPGYQRVVKKIQSWDIDEFLKKYKKSIRVSTDDLLVLSHGDLWVNNFMFKYEGREKSPTDVTFIDFQGSAFGSLGIDINYFLATSVQVDLLPTKVDKLIETAYYAALQSTLEKEGYTKCPSLEDVWGEIRKNQMYRLFCSLVILPVISVGKENSADMSLENIRNNAVKPSAFATRKFIDTMKNTIKEYDISGLLDNK